MYLLITFLIFHYPSYFLLRTYHEMMKVKHQLSIVEQYRCYRFQVYPTDQCFQNNSDECYELLFELLFYQEYHQPFYRQAKHESLLTFLQLGLHIPYQQPILSLRNRSILLLKELKIVLHHYPITLVLYKPYKLQEFVFEPNEQEPQSFLFFDLLNRFDQSHILEQLYQPYTS